MEDVAGEVPPVDHRGQALHVDVHVSAVLDDDGDRLRIGVRTGSFNIIFFGSYIFGIFIDMLTFCHFLGSMTLTAPNLGLLVHVAEELEEPPQQEQDVDDHDEQLYQLVVLLVVWIGQYAEDAEQ